METPFFGGTYQSLSPNLALDRCMNLIPEVMETHQGKQIGGFYSTPGQRFLATIGSGPVRGQRTMTTTRKLIVVVGNTVYTYDQNGVIVTIGTLNTATGPVSIIDNGTQFLVVDGYQGWVFSAGSWTLTTLTNPVVATIQDSLGLVNQLGTDQFFQSNLNDLTQWGGLNFSSADSEPSPIIGMTSLFRQIWIFKQNSTEIWNNAGLNGFAFQRMQGAYLQQGCIAPFSVSVSGDHVIWLGRDKEGGICVFMNEGYQEKRISTHPIAYAILGYLKSSQVGVADAIGFSYMQAGHRFYVLTFPSGDATWVYDQTSGLWHERGEYLNGVYHRWDPSAYAFFQNQHVVGSSSGNQLAALDLSYGTDDLTVNAPGVNPKRWMRRWRALPKPVNAPVRFGSLKLDMMTGISTLQPLLLTGKLPAARIYDTGTYQYVESGGSLPYGPLSLATGSLPSGASMNVAGLVTYTYTATGTFSWTVTGKDAVGQVATLPDSITIPTEIFTTWKSVYNGATQNLTSAAVANGIIFIGGPNGDCSYSLNGGTTFTIVDNKMGGIAPFNCIKFNGSWYNFNDTRAASSAPGDTFVFTAMGNPPNSMPMTATVMTSSAYPSGALYAGRYSNNTLNSALLRMGIPGAAWTVIDTGFAYGDVKAICQAGSTYFAVCSSGKILKSTDLVTFVLAYDTADTNLVQCAYLAYANVFVVTNNSGGVYRSPDLGATWTYNASAGVKYVTATRQQFLGGFIYNVQKSTDGITWTQIFTNTVNGQHSTNFATDGTVAAIGTTFGYVDVGSP